MTSAVVFQGQGSQFVGMGKALLVFPQARKVFREVDKALGGPKLSRLMFEGPAIKLNQTKYAQTASLAVGMATYRVLESRGGFSLSQDAAFVAGHSVGQYTALCAAESFSISDAARLVRARGEAMQEAVPVGRGAMVALIGGSLEAAQDIALKAAQGEVCSVSLDNAPGRQVLSGTFTAMNRALDLVADSDVMRGVKLPISVPSHCQLMAPAIDALSSALDDVDLNPPVVPLADNASGGKLYNHPCTIRDLLLRQLTDRVRWQETVKRMSQVGGITHQIECGEGTVLSSFAKLIDKDIETTSLSTPHAIRGFIRNRNTSVRTSSDPCPC